MAKQSRKRKAKSVSLPAPGAALSFPLADGRLGICRVIRAATAEEEKRHGEPCIMAAASSWIGSAAPDLSHPDLRTILVKNHHAWSREREVNWISEPPPPQFQYLGQIEPTPKDRRIECRSFGAWGHFPLQLLLQWRWDHDRAALLAEAKQKEKEVESRRKHLAEQHAERLSKLTYAKKRKERLFSEWEGYLATDVVKASRKILRTTIDELEALGFKPKRQDALKVLQRCIEQFNELDTEHQFINTIEREDICEHFYDLVHLTGLKRCKGLADRWRDW